MDLGLRGRVAVVAGPAPDAIEQLLASEGATVVAPDADPGAIDILVTIIDGQGELPLDGTADPLVEAWAPLVATAERYQAVLPGMRARRWGRLITVITSGVRAVAGPEHELDTLTGLGFLGLHKCVTGEEGLAGVTANAVLRAGDVPDGDVAAAVAFLASERAAYLSGITITVDGGVTPAIF